MNTGETLNPKLVFDTFVVGPGNAFARASCMSVAKAPGKAYNPLFIYNDVGMGATHLAQAIGHYVMAHSKAKILYLSCESMVNEFDGLKSGKLPQFRKKYCSADLLIVDSITFMGRFPNLQKEFIHIINELYRKHKQIIMTSSEPIGKITGISKRLKERFAWGLVIKISPPDYEIRLAILRLKQKSLNIKLDEEILAYMASHISRSVRLLEGALCRVAACMSIYHKPKITLKLVKTYLKGLLSEEQRRADASNPTQGLKSRRKKQN